MGKIEKNRRLISILAVVVIIFLYWLFRYPLNRQVNMVMTYDKNITTIQSFEGDYYVLLKIPVRGINIEKNSNISNLNIQELNPIKVECTKEQYDYLNKLASKEQPSKIQFKNSYFNPSKFKLINIG